MKYKLERIKKIIKNEVMTIITNGEIKDPRIPNIMTITRIKLSKDLHYCHIYFSMIGDDGKKTAASKGLNSAAGYIQKIIAERIDLRYTPKIEFICDENEEKSYKIDQLLDSLSKERATKKTEVDQK